MKTLRRRSLVDQTIDHLHDAFRTGRWTGRLPGVLRLSEELGVSRDTIREAVRVLEKNGALKSSGAGRSRTIVVGQDVNAPRRTLRVGLLLSCPMRLDNSHSQELLLSIKHHVEHAGHSIVSCPVHVNDMGGDVSRIARAIHAMHADAWIVYAGPHQVFEWFATTSLPVLAIGGRFQGLPVASTRTSLETAMGDAVDALIERGHQRIVLIAQTVWRKPSLGFASHAFMERLRHYGLKPDVRYNVPDWNETAEGLQKLLKALFLSTPPTALLLNEPTQTVPTLTFLAGRGLRVPEHVSVINLLPDPVLTWCRPELAHFDWPLHPHVHRTVRWVDDLAHGRLDTSSTTFPAKFVPAGTIGKAPSPRRSHGSAKPPAMAAD